VERQVETDAEVVRGAIQRFAAGGGEAFGQSWDPDIQWDMRPTGFPGFGLYRGREATRTFLADWVGSFDSYDVKIEELRTVGDGRVLVVAAQRGRASGSEAEVEMRFAQLYAVRDGRITRVETFLDADQAARQASS